MCQSMSLSVCIRTMRAGGQEFHLPTNDLGSFVSTSSKLYSQFFSSILCTFDLSPIFHSSVSPVFVSPKSSFQSWKICPKYKRMFHKWKGRDGYLAAERSQSRCQLWLPAPFVICQSAVQKSQILPGADCSILADKENLIELKKSCLITLFSVQKNIHAVFQ